MSRVQVILYVWLCVFLGCTRCCCCLPSETYGRNGMTPIFRSFHRTASSTTGGWSRCNFLMWFFYISFWALRSLIFGPYGWLFLSLPFLCTFPLFFASTLCMCVMYLTSIWRILLMTDCLNAVWSNDRTAPTDTYPKNLELASPQSVTATRLDQLVYSPNYYIQIFRLNLLPAVWIAPSTARSKLSPTRLPIALWELYPCLCV